MRRSESRRQRIREGGRRLLAGSLKLTGELGHDIPRPSAGRCAPTIPDSPPVQRQRRGHGATPAIEQLDDDPPIAHARAIRLHTESRDRLQRKSNVTDRVDREDPLRLDPDPDVSHAGCPQRRHSGDACGERRGADDVERPTNRRHERQESEERGRCHSRGAAKPDPVVESRTAGRSLRPRRHLWIDRPMSAELEPGRVGALRPRGDAPRPQVAHAQPLGCATVSGWER